MTIEQIKEEILEELNMALDTILEEKLQIIYELGGEEAIDEWKERCGINKPLPHQNCRYWDECDTEENCFRDGIRHQCIRESGDDCPVYRPVCRQCSSPLADEYLIFCSSICSQAWER